VNESTLTLALFIGIVGTLVIGYVLQSSASLGSPAQVVTSVGVVYLILKDLLASMGGGKRG
jgi:hypothetical protein